LLHAFLGIALAALFREYRYRWTALAICFAAVARLFEYDRRNLPPDQLRMLAGGGAAVLLLLAAVWVWRRNVTDRSSPDSGPSQPVSHA
jgi:hypothetical protein